MSLYFGGVTFPQQHIMASDDANVRANIFADCILTGCSFTDDGLSLAMDAGDLMIKGRHIRHPFQQSWLIEQTSGFARLLLTVSITWDGGKETGFDISATLEYADTMQGFSDLLQQDINSASGIYQVSLCIVSLDSGGVTGYVDEIDTLEGG